MENGHFSTQIFPLNIIKNMVSKRWPLILAIFLLVLWLFISFTVISFVDKPYYYYDDETRLHGKTTGKKQQTSQGPAASKLSNRVMFDDSKTLLFDKGSEKFFHRFELEGGFFKSKAMALNRSTGITQNSIRLAMPWSCRHNVSTSLIHTFSPQAENRMKEIFLDGPNENIYFANSPAFIWHKDRLLVIMRMWLYKERYDLEKIPWPLMSYEDNYFYERTFNRFLEPVSPGQIAGIPSRPFGKTSIGDGPIEPRLFSAFNESVLISYNSGIFDDEKRNYDFTLVFDYLKQKSHFPKIHGKK